MSVITEEITPRPGKREKNFSFLQVSGLVLLVLFTAIYIGETLYGNNSLQVLLSLQKQQKILDRKIKRISRQNAALQREYFELKTVMGEDAIYDQERER